MSHEAGCRYCQAHSINFLKSAPDVPPEKLEALWEYETSPLFDAAERAALRFAQASAQTPNAVTEDDFAALREHFNEDQIVEIVAVLAVGAFLNRWNDTMATALEAPPRDFAETTLGAKGWSVGKHG
jgi:alkylhydroperoxidase family enzyme